MAEASLKLGGSWATKEGSLLGFNDENGNYKPIPFDFTRATTATRVNRDGLIEEVQSGVPRIDFTGDGSLLLEPQRTNLITYSEDFSHSSWTKYECSITDNAAISPEGVQNAVKLVENTANATHQIQHPAVTIGNTNYASSSFFIKAGERSVAVVNLSNVTLSGNVWKFDLTAETATLVSVGTGWDNEGANITSVGNGWYRCVIYGQLTSTATQVFTQIRLNNGTTNTYLGDGTSGFYLYGAQVEQGSYPTSYIPTSGSAVTRNADVCQNISASDYIGQTEGTLFIEGTIDGPESSSRRMISLSDGTTTESVQIQSAGGAEEIQFVVISNGVQQMVFVGTSITYGTNFKAAIAYAENDFAVYLNGTQIGTDNSGVVPVGMNKIMYARGNNANYHEGLVNQTAIFKTRLSNEELSALTTL